MSRLSILGLAGALAIGFGASAVAQEPATPAPAGEEAHAPTHFPIKVPAQLEWSFAGVFGKYDPAQLQRGFQVYRLICSTCHSLKMIAFRNLADEGGLGYSADQIKTLAAEYTVADGPNDDGDMFERPGRPSDHFPSPFANEQAAAAANNGAAPPDLSLMAKARGIPRGPLWTVIDFFTQYQEAGPDYIHGLLTGYEDPPPGFTIPDGTYYNPFFNSALSLSMPPPLSPDAVTYSDGSPQTVDQYSRDVSAFLMWAAEPHLVDRKQTGFSVVLFLVVFGVLMYLTKKKVWARVAH